MSGGARRSALARVGAANRGAPMTNASDAACSHFQVAATPCQPGDTENGK
jgi:hypothetical protein